MLVKQSALSKILLVSFIMTMSLNSMASGLKQISYEHLNQYLTDICIVTITSVETEANYRTFLTGDVKHLSDTVTVKGMLQQSHKGDCGTGEFHSQYTTPVFTDYDELGNKTIRYTLLETQTGLELDVQPDETYAFSYMYFNMSDESHQHVRVDSVEGLLELHSALNKVDSQP